MFPWSNPSDLEVAVDQSVVDRLDALGGEESTSAADTAARAATNACAPLVSPRAMGAYGLGMLDAMTLQLADDDTGVALATLADELDVALPDSTGKCVFAGRTADVVRSMVPAEARAVIEAVAAVAASDSDPVADPTTPHLDRLSNTDTQLGYVRTGEHRIVWGPATENPFERGSDEYVLVATVLRRTPGYYWLVPGREPLDIVPTDEREHLATIADAVAAFDAGECGAAETLSKLEPIERQVLGPSGADPDQLVDYLLADPVYYPLVAVLWSVIGYVQRGGPATEPENDGDADRVMADHLRAARTAAGGDFRRDVLDNVALAGTFVVAGEFVEDATVEGDEDRLEPWLSGLRRFEQFRTAQTDSDDAKSDDDVNTEAASGATGDTTDSQPAGEAESPDATPGRVAIARFDGSVELYDSETFERERVIDAHSRHGRTNAVAWQPAGGHLLTAGWDGTVKLLDADAEDPVVTTHTDLACQEMYDVAWHPAGAHYAFGGWGTDCNQVWTVDGEKPLWTLDHDGATVSAVAFHPADDILATVSHDTSAPTVILWDLETGERVCERSDAAVSGGKPLAWTPGGDRLAIGGTSALQLFDSQLEDQLATLNDKSGGVEALAWAPGGERLAAGTRVLSVWHVDSRTRKRFRMSSFDTIHDNPGLAWNPAGTELIVAGADGTLMRLRPEDGEKIATETTAREHPGDRDRGKTQLQDVDWEWRDRT